MFHLSISLPDSLAKASQEAAQQLGISRTQFIREAIAHELENFQAALEVEAMATSFTAMKKSAAYLAQSESITDGLNTTLPEEEENWWTQK